MQKNAEEVDELKRIGSPMGSPSVSALVFFFSTVFPENAVGRREVDAKRGEGKGTRRILMVRDSTTPSSSLSRNNDRNSSCCPWWLTAALDLDFR